MELYQYRQGVFEKYPPDLNRGFLYGDGFFETIFCMEALPTFWNFRCERITGTAAYLKFGELPEAGAVFNAIHQFLEAGKYRMGRMRLTYYRAGGGRYAPETNDAHMVMQFEPMAIDPTARVEHKKSALATLVLPSSAEGNYKLIGRHRQVLAAIEAREKGLDDLILLNDKAEITEAISSNLILLLNDKLYTSPLDSGCLNGVARAALIDLAGLREKAMGLEHMKVARAIFSVNSVHGVGILKCAGPAEEKLASGLQALLRENRLL